jgi:hypothetical protein
MFLRERFLIDANEGRLGSNNGGWGWLSVDDTGS